MTKQEGNHHNHHEHSHSTDQNSHHSEQHQDETTIQEEQTHPEHENHEHHGHHGHGDMVEDFKKRFYISLILTIPILALSPMIQHFLGVGQDFLFGGMALSPWCCSYPKSP